MSCSSGMSLDSNNGLKGKKGLRNDAYIQAILTVAPFAPTAGTD